MKRFAGIIIVFTVLSLSSCASDPKATGYTEDYYDDAFSSHIPAGQKVAKILTGDFRGYGETQAFIITVDENLDPDKYWDIDYGFMGIGIYYMDGDKLVVVDERNEEGSVNAETGRVDSYDADVLIIQCLMDGYAADRNCDGLVYIVKDGEPVLAGRVDGYPAFADGYIVGTHMRARAEGGVEIQNTTYDIVGYSLVEISQEVSAE
ncbi:MAG: hypothetical protein K6G12_09735 [Lachnospiraceae bacterium]|nr:hypothetical protein [Lachnospiraceae bacterium]